MAFYRQKEQLRYFFIQSDFEYLKGRWPCRRLESKIEIQNFELVLVIDRSNLSFS